MHGANRKQSGEKVGEAKDEMAGGLYLVLLAAVGVRPCVGHAQHSFSVSHLVSQRMVLSHAMVCSFWLCRHTGHRHALLAVHDARAH